MNTQATTVENASALSDCQISSREAWLIARQHLLDKEREIARLRDQLRAERRALARAKIDKAYDIDGLSGGHIRLSSNKQGIACWALWDR